MSDRAISSASVGSVDSGGPEGPPFCGGRVTMVSCPSPRIGFALRRVHTAGMDDAIDITLYTDPACPWGYSALPALRGLEWRYGDQLRWRLVLIGLTESASQYEARGYSPLSSAQGLVGFRRYGMPLAPQVRARLIATSPACRAIVAARLDAPGREWEVLRRLQLAQFTSAMLLDDLDDLRVHVGTLVDRIGDEDVLAAYESDRREARTAAGGPGELQGKTADTDGAVRYTAPSLVVRRGEATLEAAGFQPLEAYDVLVANLHPGLDRRRPPESVAEVLAAFPGGLTTQEVAATMVHGNDAPDRRRAEQQLLELCATGAARREPLGDDAAWHHVA